MSTSVVPLQDLAQRIRQQEAELEKLRRQYDTRQGQLQKLTQRQQQLQSQLQQVEAEIAGLAQGQAPPAKPVTGAKRTPVKTATAKAAPTKTAPAMPQKKKPLPPVSLPKLLVQIVSEAKRPITIKELATEVVRRQYPSTSKRLPDIVETRVHELVKKGLLRRAPHQAGVLPGGTPQPSKASSPAAATVSKPAPAAPTTRQASMGAAGELTLAAAITKVLAASTKPLTARELADKVLALGYQSKSKDFLNVIWVGVGRMNNIEHVKGQGYRLKKGKTSPAISKGHSSK